MPNTIVYRTPHDTANFDIDRFVESLNRYGEVSKETAEKSLEKFQEYDPLHVSCLVEAGVSALADEEAAKAYYEDHEDWFDGVGNFERLRRITGGPESLAGKFRKLAACALQ